MADDKVALRAATAATYFGVAQTPQQELDIQRAMDRLEHRGAIKEPAVALCGGRQSTWLLEYTDVRPSAVLPLGYLSFNLLPNIDVEARDTTHVIGGPDKRFEVYINIRLPGDIDAQLQTLAQCEVLGPSRVGVVYRKSVCVFTGPCGDLPRWQALLQVGSDVQRIEHDLEQHGHIDVTYLDDTTRIERGFRAHRFVLRRLESRTA